MMLIRSNTNFFTHPGFLRFDSAKGVLESRQGTRLIAINEQWLKGFVTALEHETADAAPAILLRCGTLFGRRLATRFESEVSRFAQEPLRDRMMAEFASLLADMWIGCGLGSIVVDWERSKSGALGVRLRNSPMQNIGPSGHTQDPLFSGVLQGFFSYFADQELEAIQTGDERMGDRDGTTFVVGPSEVVVRVQKWRAEGVRHSEIMDRLAEE